MNRHLLPTTIGLLLVTGLLGARTTPAIATNSVVLWTDSSKVTAYTNWAKNYSATSGVAVTVVGKSDPRAELAKVAEASAPDVVIGSHEWAAQLQQDAAILPISIPKSAMFAPNIMQAFTFGSKRFGVPLQSESVALIRNMRLAQKAPKNFSDLETRALALANKNKSDSQWVPFAVQQGASGDVYHTFPLFTGLGGYLFGGSTTQINPRDIGIANKTFIRNSTLIDQWFKEGLLKSSVDADTALSAFTLGKSPYYITGPWNLQKIQQAQIKYVISAIPPIVVGSNPVPLVVVQGAMLTKWASGHGVSLQARTVLDALAGTSAQLSLANRLNRAPANLGTLKFYKNLDMKAFNQAAVGAIPVPTIPAMNATWVALGSAWVKATSGKSKANNAFTSAARTVKSAVG